MKANQLDSDLHHYSTWKKLLQATVQELHGVPNKEGCVDAEFIAKLRDISSAEHSKTVSKKNLVSLK